MLMASDAPIGDLIDLRGLSDALLAEVEVRCKRYVYGEDADGNRGITEHDRELVNEHAAIPQISQYIDGGDIIPTIIDGTWRGDDIAVRLRFRLKSYDGVLDWTLWDVEFDD